MDRIERAWLFYRRAQTIRRAIASDAMIEDVPRAGIEQALDGFARTTTGFRIEPTMDRHLLPHEPGGPDPMEPEPHGGDLSSMLDGQEYQEWIVAGYAVELEGSPIMIGMHIGLGPRQIRSFRNIELWVPAIHDAARDPVSSTWVDDKSHFAALLSHWFHAKEALPGARLYLGLFQWQGPGSWRTSWHRIG